jgi:2-polyprenyl-3-methyl-5-hydroxy-6-metoxy-1,4-benzoquinol methylase
LGCPECGCFRNDPPPIAGLPETTEEFYSEYYADAKVVSAAEQRCTSRLWSVEAQQPALLTPAENAIDIGCGDGILCSELKRKGWRNVYGIDIARSRVIRARKRFPDITFFDRSIDDCGLQEQSLDLAVMDNVIEHLSDPVGVLKPIRKYLKPSGKIVLITPNMESGNFRLLGKRWTPELAPHVHVFLYTRKSIERLMRAAGFEVVHSGSFDLPLYPVVDSVKRLISGDVKGVVWRNFQELGNVYSRVIGEGPMLYTIAHRVGTEQ